MIRLRYPLVVAALLLGTQAGYGQNPPETDSNEDDLALAAGTLPSPDNVEHRSVEACWEAWKTKEKLGDGKNERGGKLILVSHNVEIIEAEPHSRQWLAARNAAFALSELQARASLAQTMKSTLDSSRSAAIAMLGGDDAAPSLKPVVNELSIADKAQILAGKALDSEIKQYDPKWPASGSEEQKKDAALKLQATIDDKVSRSAELYAAGAFTAIQCEGPSDENKGKYSMLVGFIWSPKLAKVAESLWNTQLKLPPEPPKSTLQAQFSAYASENPRWLAYVSGARVYTNEKGERVVVGFGVAPQTSLVSADKSRAGLAAMAAIQRFVSEKVTARDQISENYERREFTNDSASNFDSGAFEQKIVATSPTLTLRGAAEVASWRGEHPYSEAGMQVVALAWSPSWAADSMSMSETMKASEQRMEQQGAVPASPSRDKLSKKSHGAAVPARTGAGASTSDY